MPIVHGWLWVGLDRALGQCLPFYLQDLQIQMDEDARQHEELREQYNLQERRLSLLQTELEEVRTGLEGSERSRKLLEQELVEVTERHNELSVQVTRTSHFGLGTGAHSILASLNGRTMSLGQEKRELFQMA